MLDISDIKKHLRITTNFDDDLLLRYMNWASVEIKNTVSQAVDRDDEFIERSSYFETAVTLLVTHYYENRKPTSDRPQYNIIFGINHAITNLKLEYSIYKSRLA